MRSERKVLSHFWRSGHEPHQGRRGDAPHRKSPGLMLRSWAWELQPRGCDVELTVWLRLRPKGTGYQLLEVLRLRKVIKRHCW